MSMCTAEIHTLHQYMNIGTKKRRQKRDTFTPHSTKYGTVIQKGRGDLSLFQYHTSTQHKWYCTFALHPILLNIHNCYTGTFWTFAHFKFKPCHPPHQGPTSKTNLDRLSTVSICKMRPQWLMKTDASCRSSARALRINASRGRTGGTLYVKHSLTREIVHAMDKQASPYNSEYKLTQTGNQYST